MSEELGYLSLKDSTSPENSYGFNKKYSEHTAQVIDQAVKNIVRTNYERTVELLKKHKDKHVEMAETLLEKEVLNHYDLREMLGDRPNNGHYPDGLFIDEELEEKGEASEGDKKESQGRDQKDPGEPSSAQNGNTNSPDEVSSQEKDSSIEQS